MAYLKITQFIKTSTTTQVLTKVNKLNFLTCKHFYSKKNSSPNFLLPLLEDLVWYCNCWNNSWSKQHEGQTWPKPEKNHRIWKIQSLVMDFEFEFQFSFYQCWKRYQTWKKNHAQTWKLKRAFMKRNIRLLN